MVDAVETGKRTDAIKTLQPSTQTNTRVTGTSLSSTSVVYLGRLVLRREQCGMSAESQNCEASRVGLCKAVVLQTFPRLPGHVTTAALTRNRRTRHVRVGRDVTQQ